MVASARPTCYLCTHMTPYLLMALGAMPGPILWVISTEAMLIYGVLSEGRNPYGMVLAAAFGQTVTFTILYLLGEKTLVRIPAARKRLEALTTEQRLRFERGTSVALFVGSVVGFPPVFLLGPLAATVHYPLWMLWLTVMIGRCIRFSVVLAGGEQIRGLLGL